MKLKVLNCEEYNKNYKLTFEYLDGEHLYPNGKGGQLGDLGTIGSTIIIEVLESGVVVESPLEPGIYTYKIDPIRREDARENHSGEHVFSALAFLKYGWRVMGFRMAENYCTLDFDVTDVTPQIVDELENAVNLKIKEGFNVVEQICTQEEAKAIIGDRKDIPEKIKGEIRVLSVIEDDFNACAGLHVEDIKDIRIFKILGYEKVKSSYTRFYFSSGRKAILDYNLKHDIVSKLGVTFSCQPENLISMINKQIDDKKRVEKEKNELEMRCSSFIFEKLKLNPDFILNIPNLGTVPVFFINETAKINDLIKKYFINSDLNYILITYNDQNYSISSSFFDCSQLLTYLKNDLGVKCGGTAKNINFKSDILPSIFLDFIKKLY